MDSRSFERLDPWNLRPVGCANGRVSWTFPFDSLFKRQLDSLKTALSRYDYIGKLVPTLSLMLDCDFPLS